MNKLFFQHMFGATSGLVYQFTGTIPVGVSPAEYITEQYAQLAGHNYVTTVVEIPRFETTVLYTSNTVDDLTSADFALITDLIPPVLTPSEDVVSTPTFDTDGNVEITGNTTPE